MTDFSDDLRRMRVRVGCLWIVCAFAACHKEQPKPAQPPGGPPALAQPDTPASSNRFEPPSATAQRVELIGREPVRSESAWRQVLSIEPEVSRFSLVIRRTAL